MSSAVLLSIVIHAALFLLAGMLVVFTVVKKEEKKFEPPKAVERPKMKLKKPKVKIKKTSKPKPTTRIVTKMNRASMPDIQLPEMSGMGEGLGGGIGGFDMMPDFGEVTVYGSGQTIGNDLEGTLYDFKRDRSGKPVMVYLGIGGMKRQIEKFMRSGWKPSALARFYRSPNKLYSPTIMIPPTQSHFAPLAFNEPGMAGCLYMLHYKGQLVHKEGGRFRFWCMGDNFMAVRVGGRVVVDFGNQFRLAWDGKRSKRTSYHLGHWSAWAGDWIDLEPGVPLDMEVIFGEADGGLFAAMLVVEQEGVDYPSNMEGGPMLPIFKTAELSRDQVDAVFADLNEDHYAVTNGPVFCDYSIPDRKPPQEDETAMVEPSIGDVEALPKTKMRQWTLKSGRSMEAELIMELGLKTVLKTARGKQVKIPTRELSDADLDYLELASPPPLKITFLKETGKFRFQDVINPGVPPRLFEITAGVKIEKLNRKPYTRELKLELFSIANEIDGDNFVLLDRQEGKFGFSGENGEIHEFWGKKAHMRDYMDFVGNRRGRKFKGHMIVITDERGEIIAQDISNDWMLDIIESLREFPVGRHFDKTGKRVYPPRARPIMVLW